MKSEYPLVPLQSSVEDLTAWAQEVVRIRQLEDLPDFTNLPNVYMRGRRIERVAPTSHSDVVATDVEGDFVYGFDGSNHNLFILVNDSGTLKWGRFNVNVSW
jgi:hypothetical protein